MRLVFEEEARMRLELAPGGFDMASEGAPLSPFHLLAGSLASCTALALESWADTVGLSMEAMVIRVSWTNADRPARVVGIEMAIHWPGLPQQRIATAERVAELCPIHATLRRAAIVDTRVVAEPAA